MAYDDDFERKIQALKAEQVKGALRKHLDPSKMLVVRAGDFVKNPPLKVVP